jgi:hypothetical protein
VKTETYTFHRLPANEEIIRLHEAQMAEAMREISREWNPHGVEVSHTKIMGQVVPKPYDHTLVVYLRIIDQDAFDRAPEAVRDLWAELTKPKPWEEDDG